MKIAIVSEGESLDSKISEALGRCSFFIFANISEKKIGAFEAKINVAKDHHGGAGTTAGQFVANEGVVAIIAKNIGPRAFSVFEQLDIKMYRGIEGSIKSNLDAFINKKLTLFESPAGRGMHK